MIIVDEILVSDSIFTEKFTCVLQACLGACCWEGDWGAPLEEGEKEVLTSIREKIRGYIPEESNQVIDEKGMFTYYKEPDKFGTPLLGNGACAFLLFDHDGIGKCGLEQAYRDGVTTFPKPVSCHLYPIRVLEKKELGFVAVNYDKWEICDSACSQGEKTNTPLYTFVKDGIIRKFGQSFYQKLESIAIKNQSNRW